MKQIYSLTSIPSDTNFIAGIDVIGNIKKLFAIPAQIPGCLFLLCIRGQCDITIHINKYKLKKNSIAIVYPDQFVQIAENTPDCRFAFVGFSSTLIQHPFLFSNTIQYAPSILEEPVIELEPKTAEVFRDYFKMLIKAKHQNNTLVREEQLPLILTGLIIELGNINKQEPVKKEGQPYTRSQEIVKELEGLIKERTQALIDGKIDPGLIEEATKKVSVEEDEDIKEETQHEVDDTLTDTKEESSKEQEKEQKEEHTPA